MVRAGGHALCAQPLAAAPQGTQRGGTHAACYFSSNCFGTHSFQTCGELLRDAALRTAQGLLAGVLRSDCSELANMVMASSILFLDKYLHKGSLRMHIKPKGKANDPSWPEKVSIITQSWQFSFKAKLYVRLN